MSHQESVKIYCPYCGEQNELLVDCSVESQHYIEDCFVCCRPIEVFSNLNENGAPMVSVRTDSD
ncbi:MAG: CPXCG motif-containing cysteine-rich protein [Pseudomonadales bacterium]|nr:CPXCG motif-containing cysteine-rich protein [Pseudomonadales bacterium]